PPRRGRFRDEEDGDDEDYPPIDPRRKVKGPGLALVIVGWIGLVLSLNLVGVGVAMPFLIAPPPGGRPAGPEPLILMAVYVALGVLSAVANVFIIIGGSRMRQCRSWGLALTAAILCGVASFLLFGLCGLPGVAFGVWAMVALLNDDVKREFDRVARRGARDSE